MVSWFIYTVHCFSFMNVKDKTYRTDHFCSTFKQTSYVIKKHSPGNFITLQGKETSEEYKEQKCNYTLYWILIRFYIYYALFLNANLW